MSTTTYVRETDEGTDTMIVTVDGDETRISYLTDGVETASDPAGPTGESLRRYLTDMESDGYQIKP
jgi:hypothetical protein